MDGRRFDTVIKLMASDRSRRSVLRASGAAAVGGDRRAVPRLGS
jgi:hypothetical protein